jgi:hypothetical protein
VRLLLHAWQPPVHAPLQQKPSTQLPLPHSVLARQLAPWLLSSWQVPLTALVQYADASHWLLLVQLVAHVVPVQR